MSLIITFMFEPAKLQMNWARASGMSTLRNAGSDRPAMSATRVRAEHRRASRVVQALVKADGGVDQGEMGEGLREVADLLTDGVDLLGVEAEVVGVGQHLREGQPCVVEPPGTSQGVDVQEGAERERPFRPGK